MKRLLLLLPLILLTSCVSPIKQECMPNCEVEEINNVILVVDLRNDYYKDQFGYYAYKFKVFGTKTTFEDKDGTWFYLEDEWDIGERLFATRKDNQLWFVPIL